MTAFYVTENGAGNKDGSSWANAIAGTGLRSELASPAGDADNIHFILVGAGTYKPTSQMTMRSHAAIIGGCRLRAAGSAAALRPSLMERSRGDCSLTIS